MNMMRIVGLESSEINGLVFRHKPTNLWWRDLNISLCAGKGHFGCVLLRHFPLSSVTATTSTARSHSSKTGVKLTVIIDFFGAISNFRVCGDFCFYQYSVYNLTYISIQVNA
jgi:hypothetical protein